MKNDHRFSSAVKGALMSSRIVLVNKTRFLKVIIGAFMFLTLITIPLLLNNNRPRNLYTKGLNDKNIVLDAGHGGVDSGAQINGITEKDITIKVVRQIEKILQKEKISVVLTRNEDSGIIPKEKMSLTAQLANLNQRKDFALQQRGSIFLSIHVNSYPSKEASGAIVYYQNKNRYYNNLAISVQKELNKLYLKKWIAKEANFVVINNTEVPSLLVEIGFLTNPTDRKYLTSSYGQEMIARAIINGLRNYGDYLGS